MRISVVALALTCVVAAPAAASSADNGQGHSAKTDNGSAATADAKADKSHKVCRMETATGSVMPKRVCHTVAELEAMHSQAAATKDSLENRR